MFKPPSGTVPSLFRTRKAALLLPLVLLLLLALAAPAWATSVASPTASAVNDTVGVITDHIFSFTATSGLALNDEINIQYPATANFDTSAVTAAKVVYLGTSNNASFSVVPGGVTVIAPTAVGAGQSVEVWVYGVKNATQAGDHAVKLSTTLDVDPATATLTLSPGPPTQLVVQGIDPSAQVVAGTVYGLQAALADQYGNVGALATVDTTVYLSDNDAQTNFGTEENATVTIPANQSSSQTVNWTPKTAGATAINAVDAAGQLQSGSLTVQVLPAAPSRIDDLTGPTYRDLNQQGTYTFNLYEEFGNLAPNDGLSVTLSATTASGQTPNVTFSSVTFDPSAPYRGSFTFQSAGPADVYTITASATGATGPTSDSITVAVGVYVLDNLLVTAPQTGEVGIASEITIMLKDQFGNNFAAPQNGVAVALASDKAGTFYDAPANRDPVNPITVPQGQSSVKVYYVPGTNAVGAHNLTFTAQRVTSTGTPLGEFVTAQAAINVGTGAELYLDVTGLNFTAGERGEVTITVRDANGNPVPAGQGGRVVYLETNSPSGKFYAAAEGGEPITEVTIPAGSVSAAVYYADTESWTKKALEAGMLSAAGLNPADYSYTVAFRSEGVRGFSGKAIVNPAEAATIILDVAQQAVDAVPDEILTQVGSQIGATDLIGFASMRVVIVDGCGNPVPQNTDLRISLKDDSPSAFLVPDFAAFWVGSGAWATEDPWLIVTAPGTYTVTASAGGFADVSKQVVFEEPSLVIDAPATALPDTRYSVTVRLTNLWAAGSDLTVNLATSTENSAFYATDQAAEPITTATIPAYNDSVTVWFESDDTVGTTVYLAAGIADLGLAATATVVLDRSPDLVTPLFRGWNIISTPWALAEDTDTLDEILENLEYVEQAWGYKDGQWYQVTTADPESMKLRPLEALYVKVKGQTLAVSWAQSGLGTPPTRDLPAGWNLVGNPKADWIPADAALASISGSYAAAVSPAGCNQDAWVYTPPMGSPGPEMTPFHGYWVYMRQADTLAGLAMPPVQ